MHTHQKPLKGFKVTDAERKTRVGIAARNFEELKSKTLDKWNVNISKSQLQFQTPDGTIIENDDFFQTLPAQTLLVWCKKGQKIDTDADILYRIIREVNEEYLTAGHKVQEFFTEKMKDKVFKLAEVLKAADGSKITKSKRHHHPEWFEGLDTNARTKEEYMSRRAQDRIRSYYYKTKDELLKQSDLSPCDVQHLLQDLQRRLKECAYFGCYFDRSGAAESGGGGEVKLRTLCDPQGTFLCRGRWDKVACLYVPMHSINPYASREERIVFQTWNLDHVVERSRSVIPAIVRAIRDKQEGKENLKKRPRDKLDCVAIFNDLFTTSNLKLCHIVCHDKGSHSTAIAGPYY